jgi:predicted DNA-binding transcriptional regulator AlpA
MHDKRCSKRPPRHSNLDSSVAQPSAPPEPAQITGSVKLEPLLDDRDLEQITGKARSTWQKSRLTGEGPPFIRLGRLVRYRVSDVQAWLSAHPSLRSTSEVL